MSAEVFANGIRFACDRIEQEIGRLIDKLEKATTHYQREDLADQIVLLRRIQNQLDDDASRTLCSTQD